MAPAASIEDRAAFRVFNAAATGMGSIDWAAVPLFAELYGAEVNEMLIERLLVIKLHKPTSLKD